MGASAPKRSVTGFHASVQRKGSPKALIAGHAPAVSDQTMPTNISSTTRAELSVRRWNRRSARNERERGAELRVGEASRLTVTSVMKTSRGAPEEKGAEDPSKKAFRSHDPYSAAVCKPPPGISQTSRCEAEPIFP